MMVQKATHETLRYHMAAHAVAANRRCGGFLGIGEKDVALPFLSREIRTEEQQMVFNRG
jgi:hypothetical protein